MAGKNSVKAMAKAIAAAERSIKKWDGIRDQRDLQMAANEMGTHVARAVIAAHRRAMKGG
jgi:hypothetical protein